MVGCVDDRRLEGLSLATMWCRSKVSCSHVEIVYGRPFLIGEVVLEFVSTYLHLGTRDQSLYTFLSTSHNEANSQHSFLESLLVPGATPTCIASLTVTDRHTPLH